MNPNPNSQVDPHTLSAPRTSPSPPLQRGKACLSCRRRKMKCDGARPVCTPCLRGERAEDCEYTDSQRRPRTLALEEDIARLRARLRELENPEEAVPSVELHAPYATAGPSTMGFMVNPYASSSGDPLWINSETDTYTRRALSVIAPYAAELGFFLNIDRLCVQGTHVVPALQSALTLWSVHITSASQPGALEHARNLTSNLLSQAQTQLAFSLSTVDTEPDPAVFLHLIQTGILLAYYMQRIGQVVGARYYASGTWALGMILRLHQSPYLSRSADDCSHSSREGPVLSVCTFAFADYAKLTRALDGIEAEERIRAFWAVYALDRWFSSVGRWPSQLLAVDRSTITVPWPNAGPTNEARNVIQHLLSDPNHDLAQDGMAAMHAKASVLVGEAAAVAASYVADNAISQSHAFQAHFSMLDALLQRSLHVAIAIATGRQLQIHEQTQALMAVHLIAFAYITLHQPFILTSHRQSQRRCAEAAFLVVQVLDRIGEVAVGVGSVGPIFAMVWTGLCLALHDEVLRLRAQSGEGLSHRREEEEILGPIRKLVSLLSALSQHYPCRFFAIKIEALLPVLESIAV